MDEVQEYNQIISNARNREKEQGVMYFKHHVLPRSLYPLFKNKKWNTVFVTYQEHKRLHEILANLTVEHCRKIMTSDLRYFQ